MSNINEFNRGYIIACCNIANLHNDPVIASDVLGELGLSKAQIKAAFYDEMAEYDQQALDEIFTARNDWSE